MKSLFQEFKEFAIKGNMVDIAIGVIIGTAFNKVIDVIVKQVIMPPLSLLTGGLDMSHFKYVLSPAIYGTDGGIIQPETAIAYGKLFTVLTDFFVIALTVFLVVKIMNRLQNRAEDVTDTEVKTPKDIELLNKMTALLEEQNQLLKSDK